MPPDKKLEKLQNILKELNEGLTRDEFIQAFKAVSEYVKGIDKKTESELKTIAESVKSAIQRIETTASDNHSKTSDKLVKEAEKLIDDINFAKEAFLAEAQAKLDAIKDGEDGEDADEERIIEEVARRIPPRMTPIEIRDALESIQPEDEQLNIEAIRGLKEILEKLENKIGGKTTIIGGNHPLSTLPDVNASGIADGQVLAWSASLGRWEAVTPSTGSGGFTQLSATEIPNGSTTIFTFASASAKPSFVISDNVWLKATTKSGSVNWTWNSGSKQATLSIPPNEDILAIV
jgi:hypothetical protein